MLITFLNNFCYSTVLWIAKVLEINIRSGGGGDINRYSRSMSFPG